MSTYNMYKDMAEILQDDTNGEFMISHFTIDKNTVHGRITMIREGIPEGRYVRLTKGSECVMSDTPMKKRSNLKVCRKAHGRVLVAGLGIGMILLVMQENPNVDEIVVVEKYQEVIDMVQPQLSLNYKVKVIRGDIFDFEPEGKFNTIYLDIWSNYNSDIYKKEMLPLLKRYSKHLVSKLDDPDRYIDCWAKKSSKQSKSIQLF